MGKGVGSDQRVQTLQICCCSEDVRSPYERVEWVLGLLFMETYKEKPSKGKQMERVENNNSK